MSYLGYYYVASVVVSIAVLPRIKSRLEVADNWGGSIVLALSLGWIIWPFAILAYIQQRRDHAQNGG